MVKKTLRKMEHKNEINKKNGHKLNNLKIVIIIYDNGKKTLGGVKVNLKWFPKLKIKMCTLKF
jgi:hypothetical protein